MDKITDLEAKICKSIRLVSNNNCIIFKKLEAKTNLCPGQTWIKRSMHLTDIGIFL